MKHQRGFTVIELLVMIAFVAAAATIFMIQKNDIETGNRDKQRKTAINAMHYALEKAYFKELGYYPQKLDEKTLIAVDPSLLKDPKGKMIGEQGSDYRYEPNACAGGKCKGYMLRADLEKEQDYIKNDGN
jgi:Tfp pilus assembly protein PilE